MSDKPLTTITASNVIAVAQCMRTIVDAYEMRRQLQNVLSHHGQKSTYEEWADKVLTPLMEDVPQTLPIDERLAIAKRRVIKHTQAIAGADKQLREHHGLTFADDFPAPTA
jgi:hypothetical protein